MRILIVCTLLCFFPIAGVSATEDPKLKTTSSPESSHGTQEASPAGVPDPAAAPRAEPAVQPSAPGPSDAPAGEANQQPAAPANPPPHTASREEICTVLSSAAQANALPVHFFAKLIWQESQFDPKAVSRAGAQGIAQFMPNIAKSFGLDDPFDPFPSLWASARMLRGLLNQFGNLGLAAAAYNGGAGRVLHWLAKRGNLPSETRKYVLHVTGHPAERWAGRKPGVSIVVRPAAMPCPSHEGSPMLVARRAGQTVPDLPLPQPRPVSAIVAAANAPIGATGELGRAKARTAVPHRVALLLHVPAARLPARIWRTTPRMGHGRRPHSRPMSLASAAH